MNGSRFKNFPSRISAILNNENDDDYRFIWSVSAHLDTCENSHQTIISIYLKYFFELILDGFDCSKGYNCSDVHKFELLKNVSINVFETSFHKV